MRYKLVNWIEVGILRVLYVCYKPWGRIVVVAVGVTSLQILQKLTFAHAHNPTERGVQILAATLSWSKNFNYTSSKQI